MLASQWHLHAENREEMSSKFPGVSGRVPQARGGCALSARSRVRPVTPACSGGFGNQTVPGVAFCGTAMHSSILSTRSLGCSHVCRSPTGALRHPVLSAPPSRTHVVVSHRPGALRDLARARGWTGRDGTAGLCRASLSPLSRMRRPQLWFCQGLLQSVRARLLGCLFVPRPRICPSCNARRMVETAAHLSDHVLPPLPLRQWVLAVPKRLR